MRSDSSVKPSLTSETPSLAETALIQRPSSSAQSRQSWYFIYATIPKITTPFFARCRLLAVRAEGANYLWRQNPPREFSVDQVADEQFSWKRKD